jgi:hypothetical protein
LIIYIRSFCMGSDQRVNSIITKSTLMKQLIPRKQLVLSFSCLLFMFSSLAQQGDSLQAGIAAKLIGLEFTPAELDSMQDELKQSKKNFGKMRALPVPNSLAYPFAFNPAPPGFTIPSKQEAIDFPVPANVSLPANKNDLAFYSLPQLASLLRHKKISSVALTTFFLERLRKWGDTLECVITITDSLAMAQAKQADAEIKNGDYKGGLHGIPYGLKDLFAVKGYKTTWGCSV